jgi:hypothetical protein
MFGRVKDKACSSCVAEPACPGITAEWRKQGYDVRPVDENEYAAAFPRVLLSKVLQSILNEPIELGRLLATPGCDWSRVQTALFMRLSQGADDVKAARERILSFTMGERARALCAVSRELGLSAVAEQLERELARLDRLESEAASPPPDWPAEPRTRRLRLAI